MESEEDYYAAVERHFVSLRGSPLFITPREWQLIHDWHERQIPLRVVREGLDRAFEKARPTRGRRPLSYCRQSVDSAFRRFREAVAGTEEAGTSAQEEAARVESHLRAQETELRRLAGEHAGTHAWFAEALEGAASRLALLASTPVHAFGFQAMEVELSRLDEEITRVAESVLGEQERRSCAEEAETILEDYRSRMPEEVHRTAVHAAYLKRLRGRLGLPALSLFYL